MDSNPVRSSCLTYLTQQESDGRAGPDSQKVNGLSLEGADQCMQQEHLASGDAYAEELSSMIMKRRHPGWGTQNGNHSHCKQKFLSMQSTCIRV